MKKQTPLLNRLLNYPELPYIIAIIICFGILWVTEEINIVLQNPLNY